MSNLFLIVGLFIGIFLNVVIHRLPQKELIGPGSQCFTTVQYLLVELFTGFIFYFTYRNFGLTWICLSYLVLLAIAIVAALIDLKWQIIPNRLIVFGLVAGLIINLFTRQVSLSSALYGLLAGFGAMLLIYFLSMGNMGGGDVKYMALVGLFLGWPKIVMVIFLSFVLGAMVSLFLIISKIKSMKDPIPFGPFISLGVVLTIYWGPQILSWYANFLISG